MFFFTVAMVNFHYGTAINVVCLVYWVYSLIIILVVSH